MSKNPGREHRAPTTTDSGELDLRDSEDDAEDISPTALAALVRYSGPKSRGRGAPLAVGKTLSERMRRKPFLRSVAENDYTDIRDVERRAATIWAKWREMKATRLEELETQITTCRPAFEEGNIGALFDAMLFASQRDISLFGGSADHGDHWVELPRWVVDALLVFASETLPSVETAARGRGARWSSRYRQNQIDLERWKSVKRLRKAGIPFTDDRVFEAAAEQLPEQLGGSKDTIRASYRRVQRRLRRKSPAYGHPLAYGRVLNRRDFLP